MDKVEQIEEVRVPDDLEDTATVLSIYAKPGQKVEAGESLFWLETANKRGHCTADKDGEIQTIFVQRGDEVRAGDVLCTITSKAEDAKKSTRFGYSMAAAIVVGFLAVLAFTIGFLSNRPFSTINPPNKLAASEESVANVETSTITDTAKGESKDFVAVTDPCPLRVYGEGATSTRMYIVADTETGIEYIVITRSGGGISITPRLTPGHGLYIYDKGADK